MTERIDAAKLQQAENRKKFYKDLAEAAEYKQAMIALDPSMGPEGQVISKHGRSLLIAKPSLSETYRENFEEGLRIRALKEGVGASLGESIPSTKPQLVNNNDGRAGLTVKDIAEVINLVSPTRSQQSQSDPASLVQAVAKVFEVAQNSRGSSDPVSSFTAGMQAMQPVFQQLSEAQKELLTSQIETLRSQMASQQSPIEFLTEIKEAQSLLGIGPEDPQIAMKKLELAEARDARQYAATQEVQKDRRQEKMISNLMGAATKIFETPAIRELGRTVARKIPPIAGAAQAVRDARVAAAQTELDPLKRTFEYVCQNCKQKSLFSLLQLESIKTGSRKWACPHCNVVYELQNLPDEANNRDDKLGETP